MFESYLFFSKVLPNYYDINLINFHTPGLVVLPFTDLRHSQHIVFGIRGVCLCRVPCFTQDYAAHTQQTGIYQTTCNCKNT